MIMADPRDRASEQDWFNFPIPTLEEIKRRLEANSPGPIEAHCRDDICWLITEVERLEEALAAAQH